MDKKLGTELVSKNALSLINHNECKLKAEIKVRESDETIMMES